MSTIIIYASKHGSVEKCASLLKGELKGDVTICPVKEGLKIKNLDTYDTIIIGCSVHAGSIQGKIKKFVNKFQPVLLTKKIGLFLCTFTPPEKAEHYFNENFPQELVQSAKARGLFGGERIFEKMNFFESFIIKKIAKTDKSASFINEKNIKEFAKKMK
jgi:menaquinone-dependent protoporphyrinogen oxidase